MASTSTGLLQQSSSQTTPGSVVDPVTGAVVAKKDLVNVGVGGTCSKGRHVGLSLYTIHGSWINSVFYKPGRMFSVFNLGLRVYNSKEREEQLKAQCKADSNDKKEPDRDKDESDSTNGMKDTAATVAVVVPDKSGHKEVEGEQQPISKTRQRRRSSNSKAEVEQQKHISPVVVPRTRRSSERNKPPTKVNDNQERRRSGRNSNSKLMPSFSSSQNVDEKDKGVVKDAGYISDGTTESTENIMKIPDKPFASAAEIHSDDPSKSTEPIIVVDIEEDHKLARQLFEEDRKSYLASRLRPKRCASQNFDMAGEEHWRNKMIKTEPIDYDDEVNTSTIPEIDSNNSRMESSSNTNSCDRCGKTLASANSLKRHKRLVHKEN